MLTEFELAVERAATSFLRAIADDAQSGHLAEDLLAALALGGGLVVVDGRQFVRRAELARVREAVLTRAHELLADRLVPAVAVAAPQAAAAVDEELAAIFRDAGQMLAMDLPVLH